MRSNVLISQIRPANNSSLEFSFQYCTPILASKVFLQRGRLDAQLRGSLDVGVPTSVSVLCEKLDIVHNAHLKSLWDVLYVFFLRDVPHCRRDSQCATPKRCVVWLGDDLTGTQDVDAGWVAKNQRLDKRARVPGSYHLRVSFMRAWDFEAHVFECAVWLLVWPEGGDVPPGLLEDAHGDGAQPGAQLGEFFPDVTLHAGFGIELVSMLVFAATDFLHGGQCGEDKLLQSREDGWVRSCRGHIDTKRLFHVSGVLLNRPPCGLCLFLQALVLTDSGVAGGPIGNGKDGVRAFEGRLE